MSYMLIHVSSWSIESHLLHLSPCVSSLVKGFKCLKEISFKTPQRCWSLEVLSASCSWGWLVQQTVPSKMLLLLWLKVIRQMWFSFFITVVYFIVDWGEDTTILPELGKIFSLAKEQRRHVKFNLSGRGSGCGGGSHIVIVRGSEV